MIVHICERRAWEEALRAGEYRPASLESEGFIHASRPEQALQTANRFYAGQTDMLLLWIDPELPQAPVRYEPAGEELFPHIYGALNLEAVQCALPFPAGADGVYCHLPGAERDT